MKSARAVVISYALKSLAAIIAFWVLVPLSASADLEALSDAQMAQIDAAGFSAFVINGNTVRADFNIQAQTYTEIGSLKMGYWDNGGGTAWDQDWTSVQMGSASNDMTLSGFFIQATFDNLADTVNRKLTSVYFGFSQVSGNLSANFESLSKIGVNGEPDDRRANLGLQTFSFNNSELSFSFGLEGDHRGIWVRFGEGTTRP
ncbi:MAG: hypothetical protein HY911_00400 [Desulfobacterales bacterium]|nr:hypothetical protein [Desulfobacterales bacterium]